MRIWWGTGRVWNRVWPVASGAAVAVGLVASVNDPGPVASVGLFLAVAMLAATCLFTWAEIAPGRGSTRRTWTGSIAVGLVFVSLTGLIAASPRSLLVVGTLGLTWAGWADVARRVRRRQRGTGPTPAEPPAPVRPSERTPVVHETVPQPVPLLDDVALAIPDSLQDDDLCLAWCSSYVALERATTCESRLRVVRLRAMYLDEMERRDAVGLDAWLGSGPRAASRPPGSPDQDGAASDRGPS
jgi:hypothetical protein